MTSSTSNQDDVLVFLLSGDDSGKRVDRLICDKIPEVGRKLAARLCEEGKVRLDGRRVRKSREGVEAEQLSVAVGALGQALPAPEIEVKILLETPHLVVADKPAGVPSAALIGKESGTLAGALLHRYPEMSQVGYGPREPGIIHRLDNYTSGLIVAARDQTTFDALQQCLSAGKFQKSYLAVVQSGRLANAGTVNTRLKTHQSDRKRVVEAKEGEGYACASSYEVLQRRECFDLVRVEAHAAFRHQIRFHLASLQAPLVGDLLYGGCRGLAPRHALHANYVATTADFLPSVRVESELPADLCALLESCDARLLSE